MAEYITVNIIIGNGEVPAIRTGKVLEWVLPGGRRTSCRECAVTAAERLNTQITDTLPTFKRRLFSAK